MSDVISSQFEPADKLGPGILRGRMRKVTARIDALGATGGALDTIGDVADLFKVPRNAVVHDIIVTCGAITGASDNDIGENVTGKTDLLMDGFTMASAARKAVQAGDEGTNGLHMETDDAIKMLWEVLGYSTAEDADQEIEISLTAKAAATADAGFSVTMLYVVD